MDNSKTISTIVGPLNFSESSKHSSRDQAKDVTCLSCSKIFPFPDEKDLYLAHLFLTHKIVISDEQQIGLLDLRYGRSKFQGTEWVKLELREFISFLFRWKSHKSFGRILYNVAAESFTRWHSSGKWEILSSERGFATVLRAPEERAFEALRRCFGSTSMRKDRSDIQTRMFTLPTEML